MQARVPFGKRPSAVAPPEPEIPVPPAPRRCETLRFFEPIAAVSLQALALQLAAAQLRGIEEIVLLIATPGGELLPTLELHRLLIDQPIHLRTHAAGVVASAGTHLFLAGAERTAEPRAKFVFHQVTSGHRPPPGSFLARSDERFRQMYEITSHEVYRRRTTLPAELIERFAREEVVLDAEEALRFGIIHRICEFAGQGPAEDLGKA